MLSMDKEAIKELTEMEAVPICNILGSLLGRSVKMSVSKVEETDMGSLAAEKLWGACRRTSCTSLPRRT